MIDDPNFQTPKVDPEDVSEICTMACMIYKNTQYPSQVKPMVYNLLAQLPRATVQTAIERVSEMFENTNTAHQYRPNFAKQFFSVQAVKEMAERPVVAPVEVKKPISWLDGQAEDV